jgi:hypothetical protein
MSKVNRAVELAIDNLARCQQNMVAYHYVVRSLPARVQQEETEHITRVSLALHKETLAAWERLAWLAPISKTALALLAERTRSWFGRDDSEVMSFLNLTGSYYTQDREAFLAEVRALFGAEKEKDTN